MKTEMSRNRLENQPEEEYYIPYAKKHHYESLCSQKGDRRKYILGKFDELQTKLEELESDGYSVSGLNAMMDFRRLHPASHKRYK